MATSLGSSARSLAACLAFSHSLLEPPSSSTPLTQTPPRAFDLTRSLPCCRHKRHSSFWCSSRDHQTCHSILRPAVSALSHLPLPLRPLLHRDGPPVEQEAAGSVRTPVTRARSERRDPGERGAALGPLIRGRVKRGTGQNQAGQARRQGNAVVVSACCRVFPLTSVPPRVATTPDRPRPTPG